MAGADITKGVSARLVVEGRPVEAGWVGLRAAWLPQEVPHHQVGDLRAAFFAGARHVFSIVMGLADDETPTEAEMARAEMMMEAIEIELDEFIQVFELQHGETEGSA